MARVNNFTKAEDLKTERQRFTEENFSHEADPYGILLFPNTYSNIQQINAKPWVVDAEQMKVIRENVFEYFEEAVSDTFFIVIKRVRITPERHCASREKTCNVLDDPVVFKSSF